MPSNAPGAGPRIAPTLYAGGTLTWRLPKREVGKLYWAVPILLVVGLGITGFGWAFLSMPARTLLDPNTSVFFKAFVALFFAAGLVPTGSGLMLWRIAWLIAHGKTRIELTSDRLIVKDGLAVKPLKILLPRPRSMALDDIRQLEIFRAGNDAASLGIEDLAILAAHHNDGGPASEKNPNAFKDKATAPLIIAVGYPIEMITDLAQQILQKLPPPRDPSLPRLVDTDPSEENAAETAPTPADGDHLSPEAEPPLPRPDTPITLETIDGGLSFSIPPRGLLKGSKGMFTFAVSWLLLTLPFGGFFLLVSGMGNGERLGLTAFMSLFWLIGFLMLYFAVKAGRTRAVVDVIGQGQGAVLLITTKHPFGGKQVEWATDQIKSLGMAGTGTRINNVPVMCLQVITQANAKHNLLVSRTNDEIEWIASVVRAEMGLSKRNRNPNQRMTTKPIG